MRSTYAPAVPGRLQGVHQDELKVVVSLIHDAADGPLEKRTSIETRGDNADVHGSHGGVLVANLNRSVLDCLIDPIEGPLKVQSLQPEKSLRSLQTSAPQKDGGL